MIGYVMEQVLELLNEDTAKASFWSVLVLIVKMREEEVEFFILSEFFCF